MKPDNFLVSNEGVVKLIDFAISHEAEERACRRCSRSAKEGPGHAELHVARANPQSRTSTPRADIYSFGCVLFELLSGKRPFTGTNADELLNKHLTAPDSHRAGRTTTTSRPSSPNVINKMMAKRREDRPATHVGVPERVPQHAGVQDPAQAAQGRPRPDRAAKGFV